MSSTIAICVFVLATCALSGAKHIQDEVNKDQGVGSGLKLVLRVIDSCEKDKDAMKCLKVKALKFVDRAVSADAISVMDGVTLVQTEVDVNRSRALKFDQVRDEEDVDDLLVERVAKFFQSHAVQINMKKLVDGKFMDVGQFFEEGRGKKYKKMMGPLILGVMWKAGLVALTFKAIALLAGKALLVANVALVLAAVLGLKKLFSSQHHEKVTYEIVKSPHVSHGYVQAAGSSPVASTAAWEPAGSYDSSKSAHYRSIEVPESENYPDSYVYHAQIPAHVQHIVVPRPTGTTQVLVGARNLKN